MIIYLSIIYSNYFLTKEYQEMARIIQFVVFKNIDSKHFADMLLNKDIDLIYSNFKSLSINIKYIDKEKEEEIFKFVDENFKEENELLNVPYLKIINLPDFVSELDDDIRDVFVNIHNLWYKYARKDAKHEEGFYKVNLKTGNKLKKELKKDSNKDGDGSRLIYERKPEIDIKRKEDMEKVVIGQDQDNIVIGKNDIIGEKMPINKDREDLNKNLEAFKKKVKALSRNKEDLINQDEGTLTDKENGKYNTSNINPRRRDHKNNTIEGKTNNLLSPDVPLNDTYLPNIQKGNSADDQSSETNTCILNRIPVPFLYFVPGGRFKEIYYWDSNWILLGLLASNMDEYAFGLVKSLTYLINKYGYIPNGGRKYYLGRSHPPVYSQMLLRLYVNNIEREWILSEGLAALEKEYNWWMTNRVHENEKSTNRRLNRYMVLNAKIPRPESFKEDYLMNNEDIYKNLWSGAESGWDFSTRWLDGDDLSTIDVISVIPVDLNVFMLMTESTLLYFYNIKYNNLINMENKKQEASEYSKKYTETKSEGRSYFVEDIQKLSPENQSGNSKLLENISNKDTMSNEKYTIDQTNKDTQLPEINNKDSPNTIIEESTTASKSKPTSKIPNDISKENHEPHSIPVHQSTNSLENMKSDIKKYLLNKISEFKKYKAQREKDINEVLWNKDELVWNDYNTKKKKFKSENFYISNLMPLYANLEIPDKSINVYDILYKYHKELFGYPGGIPVSGDRCKDDCKLQQWDFPNVWAPHVQMFIEFVHDIEYEFGLHAATCFVRSVIHGMGVNKEFHEKYDCRRVGIKGFGGEYEPQEGFGWTNGTVSWLIKKYRNLLNSKESHDDMYKKRLDVLRSKKLLKTVDD